MAHPVIPPTTPSFAVRPLTLDEYHRLIEIDFFGTDERVELIEGYLHPMSPRRPRHAACLSRVQRLFYTCVGAACVIRSQDPITLPDANSEPEPDLVLARPRPDDYADRHPYPSEILLVVEIADSSLAFDRETKAVLYAAAGIPEYWIVNLVADQVEVYRNPLAFASRSGEYRTRAVAHPGDTITPVQAGLCRLAVSEILPPREQ